MLVQVESLGSMAPPQIDKSVIRRGVESDEPLPATKEEAEREIHDLDAEAREVEEILARLNEGEAAAGQIAADAEAVRLARTRLEQTRRTLSVLQKQGMGELVALERSSGEWIDPAMHGFFDKARKAYFKATSAVIGKSASQQVERTFSNYARALKGDQAAARSLLGKTGGAVFTDVVKTFKEAVTLEPAVLTARLLTAKRDKRKELRRKLKESLLRGANLVMTVGALASSIVTGPAGVALATALSLMQTGLTVATAIDAANQLKRAAREARNNALAELARIEQEEREIMAEIAKTKAAMTELLARRRQVVTTDRRAKPAALPIVVADRQISATPTAVAAVVAVAVIGSALFWWLVADEEPGFIPVRPARWPQAGSELQNSRQSEPVRIMV